MTELQAILLGVVEGITEFLPVSSTAHLEFSRILLGVAESPFVKSFEIVIQAGAILAVLVLYARKIFHSARYFLNISIAFIPTGIIGFLLYKLIKEFLLGNAYIAAWALLAGGIVILVFERYQKQKKSVADTSGKDIEALTPRELLALGTIQALAVVPGVSRSGAVIIGGRMLGLPAGLIAEFSFVLAIPTMLAAATYDLLKSGFAFSGADWNVLLIGLLTAFAIALAVVQWLIRYVQKHSFEIFGWYRIAAGVIILLLLL